jgi:U4/U6 small nuclear ribonucleoprotein PRP31
MDAAPTTLADSLLDDLDDLSDVEQPENEQDPNEVQEGEEDADEGTVMREDEKDDETTKQRRAFESLRGHEEAAEKEGAAPYKPRRKRYLDDAGLGSLLSTVRSWQTNTSTDTASGGAAAAAVSRRERRDYDEQEYQLIVASNRYLAGLSNELARGHAELCSNYRPKFPELEELVVDPLLYKEAVRIIANQMDMTQVNDELNQILNSNQIITISVSGSTTSGRPLTEQELLHVYEAADYIDDIVDVQKELMDFVEGRMELLAPSVCALTGASVAARILGLAGGLAELSKIPACNLQVLGQIKHNAASRAGMSAISTKPHTGILSECDLVKKCPGYLQKKALKQVAAKLALAARCDFVNVDTGRERSASSGQKFRAEIESKFQKWEEPDKARVLKALPK